MKDVIQQNKLLSTFEFSPKRVCQISIKNSQFRYNKQTTKINFYWIEGYFKIRLIYNKTCLWHERSPLTLYFNIISLLSLSKSFITVYHYILTYLFQKSNIKDLFANWPRLLDYIYLVFGFMGGWARKLLPTFIVDLKLCRKLTSYSCVFSESTCYNTIIAIYMYVLIFSTIRLRRKGHGSVYDVLMQIMDVLMSNATNSSFT